MTCLESVASFSLYPFIVDAAEECWRSRPWSLSCRLHRSNI